MRRIVASLFLSSAAAALMSSVVVDSALAVDRARTTRKAPPVVKQAAPKPATRPATRPAAKRAAGSPDEARTVAPDGARDEENETAEFREKLSEMLNRTEKSIKILREQIAESQSAPFLPDLYLQLGDLLTQRSNTLYYVQMEKLKGGALPDSKDKAMAPVVLAQQEAIQLYKRLLSEFPLYPKRPTVIYRLALAYKSIDESAAFTASAGELLKVYPSSEEAMRTRLLLGQHFFERHDYGAALGHLSPVAGSPYVYERNLARYRIGLIAIAREDYAQALRQFEQVISDDQLKEQDNPYEVSLKARKTKSDLKREALIDSVRAYTHVYAKDPDPVAYYSRLAPTEVHFQETIEKLALRYIMIKQYNFAVKLLRTLSERTADPQKIVNIYREVLMMIPVRERIDLPIEEISFVLGKYNAWASAFELPKRTEALAYAFFEKQVRDLGTTAHELAKAQRDRLKQFELLKRAEDFYLLYLGFFGKTKGSSKMATNLGDVYFRKGDFLKAGEFYLRTFNGEFGPPEKGHQASLIENAILSLQKDRQYPFYENLRRRGLLMKAVQSFMAWNPKMKTSPNLNFLLAKAEFEQGFFPESLEKLLAFMKTYKKTRQARDAGELILDYFNTRNDFSGLSHWSDRMLSLKLPDRVFNVRLAQLRNQAKQKVLQEKVKETKGYDEFSVGKSYLTAALNSGDSAFANLAIREALAKSKAERDFRTFFSAAAAMVANEKDARKKVDIGRSTAREYGKLTRFYDSISASRTVQNDTSYPTRFRADALEDEVNTLLVLRDLEGLQNAMTNPLFASIGADTKSRVRSQLSEAIESPLDINNDLLGSIFSLGLNDEALLALYKAQHKIGSGNASRVLAEVRSRCGQESRQAVCKWAAVSGLEKKREELLRALDKAPTDIDSIEKYGGAQAAVLGAYNALGKSGDAHLEMVLSIRMVNLYRAFGDYLLRVAKANRELAAILNEKAKESHATAAMYLQRCKNIAAGSTQVNPAGRFCSQKADADFSDFLEWQNFSAAQAPRKDPGDGRFEDLETTLFAGKGNSDTWLDLAHEYYRTGHYHHAAATSTYGLSLHRNAAPQFKTILGCSLTSLGFLSEAYFHLKSGATMDGLRDRCLKVIQGVRMGR